MGRVAWRLTATAVAVMLLAVPVAMDWCLVTCAAGTHAASLDGDPPCHHHSASTEPAVNSAPRPCGHDHHGIIAVGIADSLRDRAVSPGVTFAFGHTLPLALGPAHYARRAHQDIRSPLHALSRHLSTALRI